MRLENEIEKVTSFPELEEDLSSQITGWKIQKICWAVIFVLLLLIALGLFGEGPLSNGQIDTGKATIEYERFSRYDRETRVTLQLNGIESPVNIMVPINYLAQFKLDNVFPDTYKSSTVNGNILFSFDTGQEEELTIHFFLYPKEKGTIKGMWMVNHSAFQLSHFIYP